MLNISAGKLDRSDLRVLLSPYIAAEVRCNSNQLSRTKVRAMQLVGNGTNIALP